MGEGRRNEGRNGRRTKVCRIKCGEQGRGKRAFWIELGGERDKPWSEGTKVEGRKGEREEEWA